MPDEPEVTSPTATATFGLTDCETRTLPNGVKAVLRPVSPAMPAQTDHERLIASLHRDDDLWWRGFWSNRWNFAASEADIRQMLADALREGRIPI